MRIERKKGYFIEFIENGIVDKLECEYDGICTVYYSDGNKKKLKTICSVFNRQYGIPVSDDGKKLFVGDWDKGLYAYDIDSGERIWKFRPGKITNIIVYSDYLIVARQNTSINKIDIETGELIGTIKAANLGEIFDIKFPYIFSYTLSKKYFVINVENMEIIKKYGSEIMNICDCHNYLIKGTHLENNILTVLGEKQFFRSKLQSLELIKEPYSFVIDSDFDN